MQLSIPSIRFGLTALVCAGLFVAPLGIASAEPIEFLTQANAAPTDPEHGAMYTYRGYGSKAVEVFDRSGTRIETISQKSLRLNKSPAHVIARRQAAFQERRDQAIQYRIDQKEAKRLAAEEAAYNAHVAAEAQRIVDLENTVKALEEAMKIPRRDRRTGRTFALL